LEREGISFAAALTQAQGAGFAEADPTDDVDGYDARAKLVILTRIGLKAIVQPEQIPCTSIRSLGAVDFTYAHELGCTIRQISRAERRDGHIYAAVQPALVPIESPMAHITGSLNLVLSSGKYGGQTAFSGHGAGGHSTAVAVVSDLLEIARGRSGNARAEVAADVLPVSSNFASEYYLRFTVRDRPGIVAAIANALAAHGININALLQKPGFDKDALPFVVTLEPCPSEQLEAAMRDISKLDFLVHAPMTMPILTKEL
jgi:homoserine dehydrogenase